jgi:hypothetical protein
VKDFCTHKVTLNIYKPCGEAKGILVVEEFQSRRPSTAAEGLLFPPSHLANFPQVRTRLVPLSL